MKKEVLIIRLSSIGDVLHCTPVARALKTTWPDCRVNWLVGEVCAELLQYNPYIDEIMIWSREQFEKSLFQGNLPKAWALWQEVSRSLVEHQFDVVLDIQGLFLTGMIARMANGRRVIGMKGAREGNSLFMKETAVLSGGHITERYLSMLKALKIECTDHRMTLIVPERNKAVGQSFLQDNGLASVEKLALLVPSTTWSSKNWPAQYFSQLADRLYPEYALLMCGGGGDKALGEAIKQGSHAKIIDAIGKTSLLDMAALIERASVVIAGDTGPLHMAAALGVPAVSLFGPTNPRVYAPQGVIYRALSHLRSCSYCHKRQCYKGTDTCMKKITVKEVVEAVNEVVNASLVVNSCCQQGSPESGHEKGFLLSGRQDFSQK